MWIFQSCQETKFSDINIKNQQKGVKAPEIDKVRPILQISSPDTNLMNSQGSGSYTVSYSDHELITLDRNDILLNHTGDALCEQFDINEGSEENTRIVTLSKCFGEGAVGISIKSGSAKSKDQVLASAATSAEMITLDNTGPKVTIQGPNTLQVGSAGTAKFVVNYEDASSISLANDDISLKTTDSANCNSILISGSGSLSRIVSISDCVGNGEVGISVMPNTAVDGLGNTVVETVDSSSFKVNTTGPDLAIIGPDNQFINKEKTANFIIEYINANSITLSERDVIIKYFDQVSCSGLQVSNLGNAQRNVALSGCNGNGSLKISIAENTAQDLLGNSAGKSNDSNALSIDNIAPTLNILAPDKTKVNTTDTVTFPVEYLGTDFITLNADDVILEKTGNANCTSINVADAGALKRNVQLSNCQGEGTIKISIRPGSASDKAGNLSLGINDSATVEVDTRGPTLTIIGPSSQRISFSGKSSFTVKYTNAASISLANTNITQEKTGSASCNKTVVSGSGNETREVTLSECSGNGSVSIKINSGTASDDLGNLATASPQSTSFQVDNKGPSLVVVGPSLLSTNNQGSVDFTINYSADAASITLSSSDVNQYKTGNANCNSVNITTLDALTRKVTLSNCIGDGQVSIDLKQGTSRDDLGNLSAASSKSYAFSVVNQLPVVEVVGPSKPLVNKNGSVKFTVNYTGATIISLEEDDIIINKTGTANCNAPLIQELTFLSREVAFENCSGDGTFGIKIKEGSGRDTNGNLSLESNDSETFRIDNTGPTLSISGPDKSVVTINSSAYFTISYLNASNISLSNNHIALNTTGNASCSQIAVTYSTLTTRNVSLSGCTGDGTVGIRVEAGTATDELGNLAVASNNSETFSVSTSFPSLSIGAPSEEVVNKQGIVTFQVNYQDASTISLSSNDVIQNTTNSASCSNVVISGTGSLKREVQLSNCTGNGKVDIQIGFGTAQNEFNNLAPGSSNSPYFNVDNTPPSISIYGPDTAVIEGSGSANFTISYTGASSISLSNDDVILNTTGSANCNIIGVTGLSTYSPNVKLEQCSGEGTVGIRIKERTAIDSVGNFANASNNSQTFTIEPYGICGTKTLTTIEESFLQNVSQNSKVDILWVIDNSPSMENNQLALAANFEAFINDFIQRGIDFKMAITTTGDVELVSENYEGNLYDDVYIQEFFGLFIYFSVGNMVGDPSLLTSEAARQDPNQFIFNFKNMVQVGTQGSGKENGLQSSTRFFEKNSSWARDDAYLSVVYLSDEEDQSYESVQHYINKLNALKPSSDMVKVYSIITQFLDPDYEWESLGIRYEEASLLTGGISADIHQNFDQTLKNFGESILNLITNFVLSTNPVNNDIQVKVNGQTITSGWSYSSQTKAISFDNSATPPEGASITVTYQICQ